MVHEVVRAFTDSEDTGKTYPNGRVYAVGDKFPATKRKVSKERIEELEGSDNRIGEPVIKALQK